MTDADLPEGMSPDAAVSWPSRELIDSYLGGHDEMFAWRPGEVVHIDGEAALVEFGPRAVAIRALGRFILERRA